MRKTFGHLTGRDLELGLYALAIMVFGVACCLVLYYSGGVWINLWGLICTVLEPLAYGGMLSYVLNPFVKHISRFLKRYKHFADDGNKRRAVAVAITVCFASIVVLALLLVFVFLVTDGLSSITVNLNLYSIDDLVDIATGDLSGFLTMVQKQLAEWGLISEESENVLLSYLKNMRNSASTALFSIIFMVYFLLDGDHLFEYFQRVTCNILGARAYKVMRLLDDADHVFSGYFRGQAIDALIVGASSAILLTIARVPYGPVVGLLAGLGNLIPYLGGPIGFGSVIVVCLSNEAYATMVVGLIIMALVMFVDGNVINPRLLSHNVEVHPMLVVAALIAGSAVGGIPGMLVAVPVAALIKIQLDRWMRRKEARGESLVDEITEVFDKE